MKLNIKLKPEFKDRVIAYGNSAKPLGERDDLAKLLMLTYQSGRQDYLDMFDNPPTYDALKKEMADQAIAAIPENDASLSTAGGVATGQPSSLPLAGANANQGSSGEEGKKE